MVRVPYKQLAFYSMPFVFALLVSVPANAAGANSPPSEREFKEASISNVSRPVQIRRATPEAAATIATQNPTRNRPTGTASQNVARTPNPVSATIARPPTSRANTNVSKSATSATITTASEAEMALALNIPLEPKSAQDARFATSDMRPQDVAPWQKIGSPYQVNGVWYIPAHEPNYDETGEASWYGNQFNGRPTANGEIFDMNLVTVAHPTLPIPSLVEVINLENGRSIVARVNDRGPFAHDRLVDVSQRGAELLGFKDKGRARVRVRYVGQAPQLPLNASAAKPTVLAETSIPPISRSQTPNIEPNKPVAIKVANVSGPSASRATLSDGAFVQIGAFSNLANAERVLDQNAGFGAGKIIAVQNENGSIYRVVIGPFDATEAALKAQEAKSSGINGARVLANIS